ncbi:glycosyl hydrolase family 61 [Drepanopeziza brunnea f. sp. 'multigermtubi' MB_m1]|uniref:Glycosyl hydrolase family 61 n=1 Tax=Marssonina brunnea f. sp. multigermtubi (strain MB_m1) TaxID=1072389 RepID=K1XU80_MARBU|nr:glycosyl hydrolase family 61 [Drepanopeziza brunnea f. sp. 'multigermtubi' MB_m1]EKD16174.1 glycosyl hydrolase family 61 [Drepanopeziza brunnea f. sp. 'multigermtubi' MB_m1]
MLSKLTLLGLVSSVVAHGTVSGIVADGIYYDGYNPSYQWITPAPVTIGWKIPADIDNGFIAPNNFGTADVICHVGATNAMAAAPVRAGGKIVLQWTPWPASHKGPVIEYLANCNGPCETVDKTKLLWTKISAVGLLSPTAMTNGFWASDQLVANNNSWTTTIPSTIAKGNYVLRHEIIGLHSASQANGAQDYPQCVSLAISGSGTDKLTSGTLGTALMKATDPGILFNLYAPLSTYTIPGPALYKAAVAISQTLPAKATATATGVYTVV